MQKIEIIKEKFRQHTIDDFDVAWLIDKYDVADRALNDVCEKTNRMCIIEICIDALRKMSFHLRE